MSQNSEGALADAIQNIFAESGNPLQPKGAAPRKRFQAKGVNKRDLELAMTVLLVDLASADQEFDQQEYTVIMNGLIRIFGTSKTEVSSLVNQAKTALSNLRGVGRFADLLKENLSPEEKKHVMDVIDEVINIDGEVCDFEVYLQHKFAGLLGIELNTQ